MFSAINDLNENYSEAKFKIYKAWQVLKVCILDTARIVYKWTCFHWPMYYKVTPFFLQKTQLSPADDVNAFINVTDNMDR